MNDTLFIGSDTVVTLEHSPITAMQDNNLQLDWSMFAIGLTFGVLLCLMLYSFFKHRYISHLEKEEEERRLKRSMDDGFPLN